MKLKLFIVLVLLTFSIYSQPALPFPETLEIASWNGSQWSPPSTTEYTFNVNCLYTLSIAKTAAGVNYFQVMGTYRDDLYPDEFIFQFWDVINNEWLDVVKIKYGYVNPNVIDNIVTYNRVSNQWTKSNKQILTFTIDDLFEKVIYQDWDPIGDDWVNTDMFDYTYLVNNQNDMILKSVWNVTTTEWDIDIRDVYNYDNGLLDFIKIDNWDSNQWNNGRYEDFTHDSDDNLTEWVLLDWDNGNYENHSKRLYSGFSDEYPATTILQSWANGAWENNQREFRVYPDCLLSTDDFSDEIISVYPNPVKGEMFIDYDDNAEFVLVDMKGRILFSGSLIPGTKAIDVSGLSQGLYILRISAENHMISRKIIIE